MKAKKIIIYLLIYCIVIEPSLLNMGCTSFYPVEGTSTLDDYRNYEDEILIRLYDGEELIAYPSDLYFVNRNSEFIYARGEEYNLNTKNSTSFNGIILPGEIDSEKVIVEDSDKYNLFWMQDSIKLIIEEKNLYRSAPDSQRGYWMYVKAYPYRTIYQKIYNSDIAGIEIRDVDWVKTSIATVLGLGLILFLIAIFSWKKHSHGSQYNDCKSSNTSTDCGQIKSK